jgi:hypothetical protein
MERTILMTSSSSPHNIPSKRRSTLPSSARRPTSPGRRVLIALSGTAAVLAAMPASAVELPVRKAGLWELKMVMAGSPVPAMTMQHCTDESIDRQMSAMYGPAQNNMCSKNDVQKTATGFTVDSVCNTGGVATTTRAEIGGDFNSAYTVKVATKMSGGPAGMPQDVNMTLEAKWLGACAADQKPGDIVMPGGIKMNIKDAENLRAMHRKP